MKTAIQQSSRPASFASIAILTLSTLCFMATPNLTAATPPVKQPNTGAPTAIPAPTESKELTDEAVRAPRRSRFMDILRGRKAKVAAAEPVAATDMLHWERLPNLPDPVGFAGPFAGTSHGALIVAGGANFPDKLPWEGGTKTWHESIFVLEHPTGKWMVPARLPRKLAYGVSVNTPAGVLCIGGGDANRHYREVFLLEWLDGQLRRTALAPLPKPCALSCGARWENTVYVAGGIETPNSTTALHTFWALDLSQPKTKWRELPPWPGPERMLAVAGAQDGSFFLFSGTSLHAGPDGKPARTYLQDAYRYTQRKGWQQIADLPRPAVAAPTPAPVVGQSQLLVLSGDDGSKVGFEPSQHPGFPASVLAYNIKSNAWSVAGAMTAPCVTVPTALWQKRIVIPNGEVRPGIRTPEVWWGWPAER